MSKKKRAHATRSSDGKPPSRKSAPERASRARGIFLLRAGLAALACGLYLARGFLFELFPFSNKKPFSSSPLPFPTTDTTKSAIVFADFMGAEACAPCHAEQYALWKKSPHGNAGGAPEEANVIAPFNGAALQFQDARVIPARKPNGDYVFTVRREGEPEQEIKVAAIVGAGRMHGGGTQSFFMKADDGTLKFLPFDFIREENTWFVQLRANNEWTPASREISLAELANWPPHRILGAEQQHSNCQNCHGSQILVEQDAATRRYLTRYQTLKINCESCHGPGRKHIALMQTENAAQLEEVGMRSLATLSKNEALQICFQCHATKDAMQPGYLPGKNFAEHYAVKFPILGSAPYLPDGRVRHFAYQENHLYSACYLAGSMTCGDCHDPHSQAYRDVWGNALAGRFANEQCTSCHASKARNVERHSHHRAGSPGSLCVSCHMPYLQHPLVGNKLRFARSDHSIPIPRPAFDEQLGIENACSKCHRDQTAAALQTQTEKWHGKLKPHHPQVARFLRAEEASGVAQAAALLLDDEPPHAMAQVTNVSRFVQRYLQPDMSALDADVVARLKRLAMNEDLEVQALALTALHYAAGEEPSVREFLGTQLQAAGAQENALRRRWAIAMDYLGVVWASARRDYGNAILSHRKALEIFPADEVTLANLALAHQNNGEYEEAVTALRRALQVKPESGSLHAQLAQAYLALQRLPEARAAIAAGLRHEPEHATLQQLAQQFQVEIAPR